MVKLFLPDWISIICKIDEGINILKLSKDCKITYKNCHDYVYIMQDMKLLTLTRYNNCQIIKLTEKGKKLQLNCCCIIQSIGKG